MSSKIIEIIIMEGIALLFLTFAYLIGIRGRLELIAGNAQDTAARVKDKDGLKRLITRFCLIMTVTTALMPLFTYIGHFYDQGLAYVVGGFVGFVLGSVILVLFQAREYLIFRPRPLPKTME